VEIFGYPVLNWLFLFGIIGVVAWATSFPLVMLLTWRVDGKDQDPNNWLIRYQWVVAVILAVIFFVLMGNAVDWQVGATD